MGKILEEDNYLFLEVGLLFLLINFNPEVSNIYMWMSIIGLLGYFIARTQTLFRLIPYEKGNFFESVMVGLGGAALFLFTTPYILQMFSIQAPTLQSIYDIIVTTFATTPALAQSKFLTLVVWGYLIPRVETTAFFRTFLQWVAYKLKVSIGDWKSLNAVKLYIIVTFVFVVFHITAKGITNNASLAVTAWFALLSSVIVLMFKEVRGAAIMHMTVNSLGILNAL